MRGKARRQVLLGKGRGEDCPDREPDRRCGATEADGRSSRRVASIDLRRNRRTHPGQSFTWPRSPFPFPKRLLPLLFLLLAAAIGFADDAPKAAAVEFTTDLAAAQAKAKTEGRPLLVLVEPKWFASADVARLDREILATDDAMKALEPFTRVRVSESEDREVHVRHRVQFRGYPLAVVLDADGTFLGSTSGLPAEEAAKAWPARVAAIAPRAKRMKELRAALAGTPEDPQTLFDLALLHAEAGEGDRAIALFDRMVAADPNGPAERLGEARWHVLRIGAVRAMAERRFADVDTACQRWLRRFASHARAPEALWLQSSALCLSGEKDRAKEIWKGLVEKSPGTDAARRAKAALDAL